MAQKLPYAAGVALKRKKIFFEIRKRTVDLSLTKIEGQKNSIFFFHFLKFYLSIVDLQCLTISAVHQSDSSVHVYTSILLQIIFLIIIIFFVFYLFRASPLPYGSPQSRG